MSFRTRLERLERRFSDAHEAAPYRRLTDAERATRAWDALQNGHPAADRIRELLARAWHRRQAAIEQGGQ